MRDEIREKIQKNSKATYQEIFGTPEIRIFPSKKTNISTTIAAISFIIAIATLF